MRILTWNLSHRGAETWERLARLASDADVALVQEARPPDARVWRSLAEADACPPLDQPRAWASVRTGCWPAGVVALGDGVSVRPRPEYHAADGLGRSHRGTLVVSDLYQAGRYVMTVASVYGMVQLVPGRGHLSSYDSMDRIVDDLLPLMTDAEVPLVLGGNFNTCALVAAGAPREGGRPRFFDRLASYGMVDCLQADAATPRGPLPGCLCGDPSGCRHVRTCRDVAGRPLQTDYLFASQGLLPVLRGCGTIDDNDVWSASNHCPVVATFAMAGDRDFAFA